MSTADTISLWESAPTDTLSLWERAGVRAPPVVRAELTETSAVDHREPSGRAGRAGRAAALLLTLHLTACATVPKPVDHGGHVDSVAALPRVEVCAIVHSIESRDLSNGVDGISPGRWAQSLTTIVVKHPSGVVLIDPGIAATMTEDVKLAPGWFQAIVPPSVPTAPLGASLSSIGIAPESVQTAVLTHAHWDHVGGAREIPNAAIRMPEAEYAFAQAVEGDFGHGVLTHQVKAVADRVKTFQFTGPAYEGFESSFDLLGDGTIVGVPQPGHTPGSTAWFVNSGDGRRLLFIGDSAWTKDGLERPAHKNRVASAVVDSDRDALWQTLGRLHELKKTRPELHFVVAHDFRTYDAVPRCAPAPAN